MTTRAATILAEALRLSDAERAFVVDGLLATLPPEEELFNGEFLAELERRWDEHRNNPGATVRWLDLKNEC